MNFTCVAKNLSPDGKLVNVVFQMKQPAPEALASNPLAGQQGGSVNLTLPIAEEAEYALGGVYALALTKQ